MANRKAQAKDRRQSDGSKSDARFVQPPSALQEKGLRAGKFGSFAAEAIRRAENALKTLSVDFDTWIAKEIATLRAALNDARKVEFFGEPMDRLHRSAHDLRGQAATLGYPLAGTACASLCRLLEAAPGGHPRNAALIGAHVETAAAIVREHATGVDHAMGSGLVRLLEQATDHAIAKFETPRPA